MLVSPCSQPDRTPLNRILCGVFRTNKEAFEVLVAYFNDADSEALWVVGFHPIMVKKESLWSGWTLLEWTSSKEAMEAPSRTFVLHVFISTSPILTSCG
jgi:hypothetical protein